MRGCAKQHPDIRNPKASSPQCHPDLGAHYSTGFNSPTYPDDNSQSLEVMARAEQVTELTVVLWSHNFWLRVKPIPVSEMFFTVSYILSA